MRRLLIILICCVCAFTKAHATVHDNTDWTTISAMRASFETQHILEQDIINSLNVILKHSTKSTLSTAGIYMSKLLERKAMANTGRFGSQEENMYYKHIVFFVSHYLTPKVFSVAQLMVQSMVRSPQNIVYWGPYLYSVTQEIRQLLAEFQYVVCNGKITVTDLFAYVICDELQDVFNFAKLLQIGLNIDFKTFFDDLVDLGGYTFNDLKEEMRGIAEEAVTLATSGWGILGGVVGVYNEFFNHHGKLYNKVDSLYHFYENAKDKIEELNPLGLVDKVMNVIRTPDSTGVSRLLQRKTIDADEYASQYANQPDSDSYFTQDAYIYYVRRSNNEISSLIGFNGVWVKDYGGHYDTPTDVSEAAVDFSDDLNENNLSHYQSWERDLINRVISACPVNIEQMEKEVTQFNRDNEYCNRELRYTVVGKWEETPYDKAAYFALGYSLQEYCNERRELYHSQLDSYKMDPDQWKTMVEKQYELLKAQYADGTLDPHIDPETGQENRSVERGSWEIVLEYSEPKPYNRIDAEDAANISMASFTANCHDSTTVFEGSTKPWVEKSANDRLIPKCKETAMKTVAQCRAEGEQTAQEVLENYQNEMRDLDARITSLTNEIETAKDRLDAVVRDQDYTMSETDRQAEISALTEKISALEAERSDLDNKLMEMRSGASEMQEEADAALDAEGYKRIPYWKNLLRNKYHLTWDNDGWWEGYTYKCTATLDSARHDQPHRYWFTATLQLQSKRQYWPFHIAIKRHARVLANMTLTVNSPSSTPLETVSFVDDETAERRAAVINAKADLYRQQWPDCEIETDVMYRDSLENDSTGNPYHLLWITDRLRIARQIELRLQTIYSTLVNIEKWMYNEQSILDFLQNEIIYRMTPVVRNGIYRDAVVRWMENARATSRPYNQRNGNDNAPNSSHSGSALPPDGGPAMARRR